MPTTTTPFLADLGASVSGTPSEMAQWWKDAHSWDRPTYTEFQVESDEFTPDGGRTIALVRKLDRDYLLWKTLGSVEVALFLWIVLLILALFL